MERVRERMGEGEEDEEGEDDNIIRMSGQEEGGE
jgi:hypothetical protein